VAGYAFSIKQYLRKYDRCEFETLHAVWWEGDAYAIFGCIASRKSIETDKFVPCTSVNNGIDYGYSTSGFWNCTEVLHCYFGLRHKFLISAA